MKQFKLTIKLGNGFIKMKLKSPMRTLWFTTDNINKAKFIFMLNYSIFALYCQTVMTMAWTLNFRQFHIFHFFHLECSNEFWRTFCTDKAMNNCEIIFWEEIRNSVQWFSENSLGEPTIYRKTIFFCYFNYFQI